MRSKRSPTVALVAVTVVIAITVVSIVLFGGRPREVESFRETGPSEITVRVCTGEREWTRVTSVAEDANSVTVGVTAWAWPMPGSDLCIAADLVVLLDQPLAGRAVRNADDGAEAMRHD